MLEVHFDKNIGAIYRQSLVPVDRDNDLAPTARRPRRFQSAACPFDSRELIVDNPLLHSCFSLLVWSHFVRILSLAGESFTFAAFSAFTVFVSIAAAQDGGKKPERPTASAIFGTPKIDGEIDEAWNSVPAVEVKKIAKSETSMPEANVATGTVKLMWDKDYLYALWQVKDSKLSAKADNAYEQDSIELFVDELHERAGAYQKDDAQYRVSCEGKLSGAGEGYKEKNLKAAVKRIDGGYLVEMSVRLFFAKREGGTKMGLELQLNDDPGTGSRGGVSKWNHAENDSYQDTSNFGIVLLKAKTE